MIKKTTKKKVTKKKSTRKVGRPTRYTNKLADLICSRLSEGESLRTVCKSEDMPCKTTVFMWLRTNKRFLDQYTRAKEESADALTDEMLDIADDGQNDWMDRLGENGENEGYQLNGEHIQRSRLRIETRKWLAMKLKPKKYGDKLQQDINITDKTPKEMTDAELEEAIKRNS